jgi:hypothetical protein
MAAAHITPPEVVDSQGDFMRHHVAIADQHKNGFVNEASRATAGRVEAAWLTAGLSVACQACREGLSSILYKASCSRLILW